MSAPLDPARLASQVKAWGRELGFQKVGIAGVHLPDDERRLLDWLAAGRHGGMRYMKRHGARRARPAEIVPGTIRVVSARMDYWPGGVDPAVALEIPDIGYVSRYAVGRDYHKVLRNRLARLADRLADAVGAAGYRAYTDTGPVLEKALARDAGLGWIGKHTNLLDRQDGSWFFLGEVFTDVPLPVDAPVANHCGSCTACIDVCPTRAIVAPYELDARRCISYLTIEHEGPIPEEFRAAIGNRIYGCDDCQLVCPWNRYAKRAVEPGFHPRNGLDGARLVDLFSWSEAEFDARLNGNAIRRIGHVRWLRNVAIALGNAPPTPEIRAALARRRHHDSEVVREAVEWALSRGGRSPGTAGCRSAGHD